MYSYARITKIKKDLIALLSKIKTDPKFSHILSATDIIKFESAIADYDVHLNKIGKKGYCTDQDLNSSFDITEKFISAIRTEIYLIKNKK